MKKWLLLIALVVIGAVGAQAQDRLLQVGEGYTIVMPDGWTVESFPDSEPLFSLISPDDDFYVIVVPPGLFTSDFLSASDDTALEAWAVLAEAFEFEANPTETTIDGRDAAYGANGVDRVVVLQMSDGYFGGMLISGTAATGRMTTLMNQFGETFDGEYSRRVEQDLEGVEVTDAPAETSSGTATTSGEPCTVSTATRDSARLRVGPGENRGAIAFLPVNTDVTVTGRIEEDDGDVWYQLDKDQAMPGTSANEIWVAADEVDAEGGCDAVGEASAPPVIPGGVVAPPNPGGGAEGGGGGVVTGGNVPVSGSWTVNTNPTTNASCQGGGNVAFSTLEVFGESLNYRVSLSVRGDGSSFSDGRDTYTRTAPGAYFGTRSFANGENGQVYLSVTSARSMSGQIVGNFTIDNIACSFTIGISLSAG